MASRTSFESDSGRAPGVRRKQKGSRARHTPPSRGECPVTRPGFAIASPPTNRRRRGHLFTFVEPRELRVAARRTRVRVRLLDPCFKTGRSNDRCIIFLTRVGRRGSRTSPCRLPVYSSTSSPETPAAPPKATRRERRENTRRTTKRGPETTSSTNAAVY